MLTETSLPLIVIEIGNGRGSRSVEEGCRCAGDADALRHVTQSMTARIQQRMNERPMVSPLSRTRGFLPDTARGAMRKRPGSNPPDGFRRRKPNASTVVFQ